MPCQNGKVKVIVQVWVLLERIDRVYDGRSMFLVDMRKEAPTIPVVPDNTAYQSLLKSSQEYRHFKSTM